MRSHLAHFHRYKNISAGANYHKAQMDGYPVHPHTSNISQVDFFSFHINKMETLLLNVAFR